MSKQQVLPRQPDWFPFAQPVVDRPRPAILALPNRAPASVRVAVVVMAVRIVVVALAAVVAFAHRNEVRDQIVGHYPLLSDSTVTALVNLSVAGAGVGVAVWTVCYAYLITRVRLGGNTARVIAITFAWLGIAAIGYAATHTHIGQVQALLVADALCDLAVIVLLTATPSWNYANRYGVFVTP